MEDFREAFVACFSGLDNPPADNAWHDLHEVLMIVLCATLCGGKRCVDMAEIAASLVPVVRRNPTTSSMRGKFKQTGWIGAFAMNPRISFDQAAGRQDHSVRSALRLHLSNFLTLSLAEMVDPATS